MSGHRRPSNRTDPAPLRCVVYTRKSTDKGLDHAYSTLDAQRDACEQYIRSQAARGWQLSPRRYDDGGFTGANLERPAFQRLMKDIDEGTVDVVVVYKVDRLSRSLLDFARVMDRFSQAGTAFVSVTQNFSTADAIGRLTLHMLMSFAEFEREMIAERIRDRIAASRRKGKWCTGTPPLGYVLRDKRLQVVETEAEVVRAIFGLYLEEGHARGVTRALNEALKRPSLVPFNPAIRNRRRWTRNQVLRILENPLYLGYVPHQGELYPGEHEAILDRETFDRVQALIHHTTITQKRRHSDPAYLLRGRLFCGECGAAMTTGTSKKRGKDYRYYRCHTRNQRGRDACATPPFSAEPLEDYVVAIVMQTIAESDLAEAVAVQVATRGAEQREFLDQERGRLPTAIAELSAEADTLLQQIRNLGEAAGHWVVTRLEALGQEIRAAESRLAEVERLRTALNHTLTQADWIVPILQNFAEVWEGLHTKERGRLVHALVQRIEVDAHETITVTLVDLVPALEVETLVATPPCRADAVAAGEAHP